MTEQKTVHGLYKYNPYRYYYMRTLINYKYIYTVYYNIFSIETVYNITGCIDIPCLKFKIPNHIVYMKFLSIIMTFTT